MSDEFDDLVEPKALRREKVSPDRVGDRGRPQVARLVSRLYATASGPMRASLMDCLLQPLGTLGLAGIAAGAFAGFLYRGGTGGVRVVVDDLGRYSNDQIFELARFVEQVSPEALQQFASLIADNPVGVAAFSASAVMLLVRALRPAVSQPQLFRQDGRPTDHPADVEGDGGAWSQRPTFIAPVKELLGASTQVDHSLIVQVSPLQEISASRYDTLP